MGLRMRLEEAMTLHCIVSISTAMLSSGLKQSMKDHEVLLSSFLRNFQSMAGNEISVRLMIIGLNFIILFIFSSLLFPGFQQKINLVDKRQVLRSARHLRLIYTTSIYAK